MNRLARLITRYRGTTFVVLRASPPPKKTATTAPTAEDVQRTLRRRARTVPGN